MSSIIYTDSELVCEKVYSFENNPENSFKTTIFARFIFYKRNKINHCKRKECMKMFCGDLKDHAMKVIN